jgi:hypothetical protein
MGERTVKETSDIETILEWLDMRARLESRSADAWNLVSPRCEQSVWRAGAALGLHNASQAIERLVRGERILDDFKGETAHEGETSKIV